MAHTFDPAKADRLEDVSRYRYCSRDDLISLLSPSATDLIVDLGSGTGFYTRDVAPHTERLVGVDIQPTMHGLFQEHGVPTNTALVTGGIDALPFDTDVVDVAFSTMTFHEIATPAALREVARVLRSGGRFVTVDWSANGLGEAGPPREDCVTANEASAMVSEAGFTVRQTDERVETFVLVATS